MVVVIVTMHAVPDVVPHICVGHKTPVVSADSYNTLMRIGMCSCTCTDGTQMDAVDTYFL